MQSPLLVLVVRAGSAEASEAHARAVRAAFDAYSAEAGGDDAHELLQPGELRELNLGEKGKLEDLPLAFLGSASRVLAIILDTRPGRASRDIEQALSRRLNKDGQAVLAVYLNRTEKWNKAAETSGRVTRLSLFDLDERDLRLPFLTLYVLHAAIALFTPPGGKGPRLFFSHAKRDGVPLTTAARDWMKRLRGFKAFYDTENLKLDGNIDKQLDKAVSTAIVIVFRSEIFDQRYWCQKEVLWAEQHGRPVITVDARWQVEHKASVISFDGTPVVRIPDGSVVRIFTAALTEALRVALFAARVEAHKAAIGAKHVRIVPRVPSLVSLHQACLGLPKDAKSYVVYPNPALPEAMTRSTLGLAQTAVPLCEVKSLDEFRLVQKEAK